MDLNLSKVLTSLHRDRDIVVDFCKKFDRIYLYGAGLVSSRLIVYLEEECIDIEGIIVSDNISESRFQGYPVKCVNDIEINSEIGIIIAVSETKQGEILENLACKLGFNEDNILCQKLFDTVDMFVADEESYYAGTKMDGRYFNQYNTLDQFGRMFGTDKSSAYHAYLGKYEFILNRWKDEEFRLLELGVFQGESLKMWGEYFANAEIVGVDINPSCADHEGENRRVLIKDLSKTENLEELRKLSPRVIIDDASHWWSHQIKALMVLFPSLEEGGVYIVEDIGTSFGDYKNSTFSDAVISTYEFCRMINDYVTGEESKENIGNKYITNAAKSIAEDVDMMCFIHGSVIIIKR